MAELSPYAKFGVGYKSGSANNIGGLGIYMNMNTLTDVPYSYGTLFVLDVNGSHIVQFYISAVKSENNIYVRQRTDNAWSSWLKL